MGSKRGSSRAAGSRGSGRNPEAQGKVSVGRRWEDSRRVKWRLKEIWGRDEERGGGVRNSLLLGEAEGLRQLTGQGGKDWGESCEGGKRRAEVGAGAVGSGWRVSTNHPGGKDAHPEETWPPTHPQTTTPRMPFAAPRTGHAQRPPPSPARRSRGRPPSPSPPSPGARGRRSGAAPRRRRRGPSADSARLRGGGRGGREEAVGAAGPGRAGPRGRLLPLAARGGR